MSGIAGIVHFDQTPVIAEQLNWMLDAMSTRGPHGREIYITEEVGLGQVILRTTDPGTSQEPIQFTHLYQHWILVFDGRIYNQDDLQRMLGISGDSGYAEGDGRIVLAAFEKWGQACPQYLLGDYALVIWDCQARILFCARDHFGVKPFYYYATDRFFLFASDPEAILAAREAHHQLNKARIADFLLDLEGEDTTSTFYENLFRLPAGYALVVQAGEVSLRRYWELSPASISGILSERDYIEAFEERFTEAVRCRIQNPVSTAVSLSGGLDSSVIFVAARKILAQENRDPLRSYSFVSLQDPSNLETQFIQILLNQGDMQAFTVPLAQVEDGMNTLLAQLDNIGDPFDWGMNIWRVLYRQAQGHKIQMFLDGVDGDLLLADSNIAKYLWRSGQIRAALGETILAGGMAAYYYRPWILLYQSLRSAFVPEWVRQLRSTYNDHKTIPNAIKNSIINPDFARMVRLDERLRKYQSYSINPKVDSQTDAHRRSLNHPHLQAALERYDRVASTYSIEPLHPLLDVRLVEFCLSLPWQLKTKRGWTKMAMRKMLEPLLPAEVVWRKDKHHLGWSVNLLVLKSKKDYFRQLLDDGRGTLDSYIDLKKLDELWDRFNSSGDDESASLIWDAIALALWLRRQKSLLS